MYPASFEYVAPATLEEALDTLGRYEDDAKVLAGGQSLIPLMKLRFAAPRVVVDINRLPGLDTLAEEDGGLRIGALVRHKTCEKSELLGGRWGTLGDAAPLISDPIIRNLGTVCGSLAHADPQGDWGSALLAMDAEVVAQGPDGSRMIPLRELFEGPFVTSLAPTEIITEARVPDPGPAAGGTYLKLERKVGDFATVGVAVHVVLGEGGKVGRAGIALTAVGPTNLRATAAEEALVGSELNEESIREAARLAAEAAQPHGDTRGSADYKRTVVRVFTERGLRAAAAAVGAATPRRATASGAAAPVAAAAPSQQPSDGGAPMAQQRCPNCGAELPMEEGQHALAPAAGVVQCPTCGATVTLDKPGADGGPPREGPADGEPVTTEAALEATDHQDYFSGEETLAGVMEEIDEKEDGGER
ncbi:MAG TPA: FAD binding domain-containing protein [Actinomycetes bacterium]|nr:FAD binding domain-containing protein [Actinomycetes bacterium]